MVTAIIFDLDDTLYEEGDFFRSGFAVVAHELERRGAGTSADIALLLEHFHFAESRAGVFQKLASRLKFPEQWIPDLVERFRSHDPRISLAADTLDVLPRLRSQFRIGCITDGWAAVQRRKLEALRVEPYLHGVVLTDELGRDYWKPHARAIHELRAALGGAPHPTIVVGDNPERDMAGARNAGLRSIRLRRRGGYFADKEFQQSECRADFEISDLRALPDLLNSL
jgi:putative hydrolase of the HAD superfamily